MTTRIHFPIAALMIALLAYGCSDPCKNTYCLNGGACVEGECLCPDGYSGPHCEVRDLCYGVNCLNGGHCDDGTCICPTGYAGPNCGTALTPVGVKILKVKLVGFPARNENGIQWDRYDSSEPQSWPPDLYVEVLKGTAHLDYSHYTANCDATKDYDLGFDNSILYTPLTTKCTVKLFDYDHQQNADDYIGGYYFYFSEYTAGYPSKITLYNSNTWHKVKMEVYVEWLF